MTKNNNKSNKRFLGQSFEEKTAYYLLQKGYNILEVNFYNHFGELDIIASKDHVLHIVEVKYRKSLAYGHPAQSVDYKKQLRIRKGAMYYMKCHGILEPSISFDIACWIGNELEYIESAF